MAAAPRRLQQHRHRARRRTITRTTTPLVLFVALVCAPSTPLLRAARAADAANATNGPPPILADVVAARAAWAGTGWAGAPPALPIRTTTADSTPLPPPTLQQDALDLFDGALLAYLKHAFPRDNLLPLSCTGQDWQGGGMALTLVDALDSLLLLPGRGHLLPPAVEALRERGVPRAGTPEYDRDAKVHVFETTIRVLGGLLSAHVLLQRLGPQELAPPLPSASSSSSSAAEAARALLLEAAAGQGGRPNNNETTPSTWRYDAFLLHLARDLADRMLPAFRTPSGVPLAWAHLQGARRTAALADNHATCTACAGTLLLEFGLLSHLTGEDKYRAVASKAADALFARRTRLGLVGSELSVAMALGTAEEDDEVQEAASNDEEDDDDEYEDPPPPEEQRAAAAATAAKPPAPAPHPHHLNPGPASSSPWTSALSTIGPGSDSYYEYLLKAFLQTGDTKRLREFCALFTGVQHLMALSSSSAVGPKNAAFVLDVRADDGRLAKPWVSSLGAFWPGLQALVGQTESASALVGNFSSAAAMHGWLPEVFAADLGGAVHSSDAGWRLRPELAESAFLLHAATGDPRLRSAVAAPIARALRAVRRGGGEDEGEGGKNNSFSSSSSSSAARPSSSCPGALAHVADVRTGALEDASESYALSETLKYVSLIATPGSGALVDAFVLTTEGHLVPAEPRRKTRARRGDSKNADDNDNEEAAADEAEAEDLARQGLLPSSSTPLLPPTCRSLCADVGPGEAARSGRERAAARAVVDSLSRALPLVRAKEQEVVRLRRRRCAACVAVAQHLQQHPAEPPARRAARLNFGGPAFVAPLPSPPSPLHHRRPLPRPQPLRVPLPSPRRTAPPFHPPAHHRPPPAPEPLAAAVCLLDAGRWALSLRREPLRCAQAKALGALDLSTGQMPQSAVVLQLARVVGPAAGAEEASGGGGSGASGNNGNGEGEDADVDGLLPAHGLVVSFEDGAGSSNSSDVVWFDATPPHFGPRPPLVATPECARVLRTPRPRLAAQPPCPPHAPLLLSFRSASSSSSSSRSSSDGICPSAEACEEAVAAASANNTTNSLLLLRACAGGLDPSAAASSSSSFPIPRWLPDAELDDPARPCGSAEAGAGVPMLAAPLVVAQPFDACAPSSSSPPPLNNAPFLRGAIALVERGGGCSFVDKVLAVQAAGAAGAVVLNTPRAAAAAARDEARQHQQQGTVADRGTCSAAEAAAAASSNTPPEYQHPSAMADDAWRGGERPRIPAVMLAPGASAALLKAVRERGGGVATLVARHAQAGSMAVGEDGVVVEVGEDEREEEGDYGDDDDEEEEGKSKADAPSSTAAATTTNPPPTWLTLDRLQKRRVRERVDLLIPPASRDFVTKFVLFPLQQQRQRWEAGVAAALMMAGGMGGGMGGGALGRAAAAAGAIPAPPLTAEEAFSQLAFDPKVKEVLAAGRAETLREEKRAAKGVASAAAQEQRRRRRQQRIKRRNSKGQHD